MPSPIKILIVEDNPADAGLMVAELRRAGFEPEWQRVDSEAAYLAQMPRGYDLVLASDRLPQFSGLRALTLLRQAGHETPFILIADTPGEDAAVAAMKAGATDYLRKNRLNRLGESVARTLEARRLQPEQLRTEKKPFLPAATEGVATQAQLLQAQKMEAIGQLAGGIAHDFNNSLTVITGYTRLLLDNSELREPMADQLRQVYTAGMHAANLTRQLLLFSRRHAINKRVIDLNEHLTELTRVLGRVLGETIRLEVKLDPALPALNADAGMIEQILMNLAMNAREAMPEGGVLSIGTTTAQIGESEAACHAGARPGPFICLTIGDTGCGIAPEHLPRIFEPFFTTKAPDAGTGLGLATVFGIVQEHGGWIEVESRPAAGTRFRILLPPVSGQPADHASAPAEPAGLAGKGAETILVVEDEAPVRDLVVAVLEHYGYRVLQADDGATALEVWKWHSQRIALLLTDVVLSDDLSGAELSEQMQREKPGLKVVLMSGYAKEYAGKLFPRRPQVRFIQKPFPPQALEKIVREILDEPAPQTPADTRSGANTPPGNDPRGI
jgi:signal transduction histidine kinase